MLDEPGQLQEGGGLAAGLAWRCGSPAGWLQQACTGQAASGEACFAFGEASGDSEGNDSRVFAVSLLVIADCRLDPARIAIDLLDAVDSWEDERCSLSSSPALAITRSDV